MDWSRLCWPAERPAAHHHCEIDRSKFQFRWPEFWTEQHRHTGLRNHDSRRGPEVDLPLSRAEPSMDSRYVLLVFSDDKAFAEQVDSALTLVAGFSVIHAPTADFLTGRGAQQPATLVLFDVDAGAHL